MRIKSVTLYSLPYVVAVASFLVAAHQVAPSPNWIDLRHTNTKAEIFSGQTVNRSIKGNRLPMHEATPDRTPEKGEDKGAGTNRENPRGHHYRLTQLAERVLKFAIAELRTDSTDASKRDVAYGS
jgi:hypothetical protein